MAERQIADELGYTSQDIVTRLREQAQAPALAWLTEAAVEIEQLRHNLHTTQTHLHQTLIALNDLTAIPTHPQHQQTARTTLANILNQRHLTINAIRPHTPNSYGT